MLNLVLIGMTACGKSTLGERLAKQLNRPFIDLDTALETEYCQSISQMVETHGVDYFRDCERATIEKYASLDGYVISTGGGAVLDPRNVALLQQNGVTIWIYREIEALLETLDSANRPLASSHDRVREMAVERHEIYTNSAMYRVENTTLDEGMEQLLSIAEKVASPARYAVIGTPVGHSISPEIHLPCLKQYRDQVTYDKVEVAPEGLSDWVEQVRREGICGFNITMPHKITIMPFLDALDHSATYYGSVNTVVVRDGELVGYNTDADGFYTALTQKLGDLSGKKLVFLGAGGVATALVQGGVEHAVAKITILARSPEKAQEIIPETTTTTFVVGRLDEVEKYCSDCDVLIHCTPLGMEGVDGDFEEFGFLDKIPQGGMVCDLIYKPAETKLLAQAKQRGLTTQNGLSMLIYQGLIADHHYTQGKIDYPKFFEKIKNLL